MKNFLQFLKISALLLVTNVLVAQNTPNVCILHADSGKHVINKHIYGHFSEHLGHCIYGGIYVGENPEIPNTKGIRNDVANALKNIAIPNLRWPGGCFADEYHWMEGIGSKDKRPTMINTHWGGVTEDNSFGTHEFMDLCEILGCEPIICGNVGSGTVREMSRWIEYLNSDNISPMTNLRKENGREKSWKVKYWGIGNENWGCGGAMKPDYYSDVMRRFSVYCKNYGENKLYRVACGPSGGDYNWMEILMKNRGNSFQGISLHYYTVCHNWHEKGSATDFDENEWFTTLSKTIYMDELITKHSEIMDKYDPDKKVGLIVDEWGNWHDVEPGTNPGFLYQQNTLRDALTASLNFDIFNKHCERVVMANIAQVVNVLQSVVLTKDDKILLTPTYYVFKMYKVHHDATLLPIEISCDKYSYEDKSIPAISASASKDKDGKIHITMTNVNPHEPAEVKLDLEGIDKSKITRAQIITAEKMNSYNDFGKDEEIYIKEFKDCKLKKNTLNVTIPSKAIIMIEIE